MARDCRDRLEVLRFELYILQQGAYRSSGRGWPHSLFQDSPTCLNFGESARRHPCRECLLAEFIPEHYQNGTTACHHIPLDGEGNTVASLARRYNRPAVEKAVSGWLQETVATIERERSLQQVAR